MEKLNVSNYNGSNYLHHSYLSGPNVNFLETILNLIIKRRLVLICFVSVLFLMGITEYSNASANEINSELVEKTRMSDKWEFFVTNVDDNVAFVFFDYGISESLPIKERPLLLQLIVKLKMPDENGLPLDDEYDSLSSLEKSIDTYCSEQNLIFIGRVTVNGIRVFYIYSDAVHPHEKNLEELVQSKNKYQMKMTSQEDKDYNFYWEGLYPSEMEWEAIQNRHVIENLEAKGELFVKERRIDHWIYFKNKKDKDSFRGFVESSGFKIGKDIAVSNSEESYGLLIYHTGIPTLQNMNEITIPLFEQAKKFNGRYDGWETSVEK